MTLYASPAVPPAELLEGGLILRTATSQDDIDRVAAFHAGIFEPNVGPCVQALFTRHPHVTLADQFLVETAAGEVVSALCLIPWTWRYGVVDLPVGEMGLVATAPAYRRMGLIRRQVEWFKRRLAERGCLLSNIQGIPFYYRQYGYDYALPLGRGWQLELRDIPEQVHSGYSIRPATLDDLPVLQTLYAEAVRPLTIHTVRDPAIWRYQLEPYTTPYADTRQALAICALGGQVEGYAQLPNFHFGPELEVNEVSRLRYAPAMALLHHLRRQAEAEHRPFIRLNLPASSDLVQLAQALGAVDLGTYAWQIHIPDLRALVEAIGPTLEARLADSLFAGLTRIVRISSYQGGLSLEFERGRLTAVRELGRDDKSDMALPPFAFMPLLLGYRTLDELRAAYPDVNVHGEWRLLLSTLFPRSQAFLYPTY